MLKNRVMNENLQTPVCSRCGAPLSSDALKGLCPRCLMALNLAAPTEIPGETGPHGTKVIAPPPPLEEIAKHFPQLDILECLGRGGMGVVYKARQPKLNRQVALKILAPEKGADPKFAERFQREAQALARLNHPNIVTIYDFGEVDGMFFLVMEYVDGMTLRHLLREGHVKPEQALAIVPKICEALQFAHEQGVVHRDIKPENVLLDKQGRVKIADFGIAKIVGGTTQGIPSPDLTATLSPSDGERAGVRGEGLTQDQVLGTPNYMAPEQMEKPQLVDHRADIYSLGVVFYEMLTGELPLGKFQPPSKKVQVDVRLDEVVLHALEKEPERRYQYASQVKSDVETIATGVAKSEAQSSNLESENGILGSDKGATAASLGALAIWLKAARWTARILGTLFILFVLPFVLAEGVPAIASQPTGVQLTFLGGFLLLLGFVVGWWREGTAAALIAAGWTVIRISESNSGILTVLDSVLVVAGLYAFCWWTTQGRKIARAVVVVAVLAVLLVLGRLFCPVNVFVSGVVTDTAAGSPISGVELRLLPRPARSPGETDSPNTRSGNDGRYRLYAGWYFKGQEVQLTAPGYETKTTALPPRPTGRRWLNQDFQMARLDAASPIPSPASAQVQQHKYVRLVVDSARMTFQGESVTWDALGALLTKVPDRTNTVLEVAVTSDQITVAQQNEWFHRAVMLARECGFAFSSFIGIHPLGSKGTSGASIKPTEPDTGTQTEAWHERISAMNGMNWRQALATANEVAALPPEEGLAVVRQYWTTVTNAESRKQFLKAFNFSKHPRQMAVLELGVLDPAPEVQGWAFEYLKEVALRDFTTDYAAAKTWLAERRDRTVADVMADSVQWLVDQLRRQQGDALRNQLELVERNRDLLRDYPDACRKAGLDARLAELCSSTDEATAAQAIQAAARLNLGEDWARKVLLPRIEAGNPPKVRDAAFRALGSKGRDWALEPMLASLTNAVLRAKDSTLTWTIAQSLAEIGSPKVIPAMIGLIGAENTYDTVYGIGYFGLGKLTGVSYDKTHDGAWWRQWWEKNRERFPAEVRAVQIPRFEPIRKDEQRRGSASTEEFEDISAEEHFANSNTNQHYWLIRNTSGTNPPATGHRLLLVLPGGDGGSDFRPFVQRICKNALPDDFLVAELIAPKWDAGQFEQLVWPTERHPYPAAKFSTEEFVAAVVKEVRGRHNLATNGVFTLSWSSGGPAAYAASLDARCQVAGSFVAMSVFKPDQLPDLGAARGKSYYLLQSPKDFIPFRMVEDARERLTANGARVRLQTYEGGHGWHGDVYGMIRAGIVWLEESRR